MMKRAFGLAALLVLGTVAGWGISVDPAITYTITGGTIAGYSTVGIPFRVVQPISVVALGAFDYLGSVGLSSSARITVSIQEWNGSVGLTPNPGSTLASVTLTSASPAYGGNVWKTLTTSTLLNPGWYFLTASGFTTGQGSSDPTVLVTPAYYALDTFNNAVQYGTSVPFGGNTFWLTAVGTGSTLDTWIFGSTPIFIAGGSFAVPEPSTYAMMGTVGLALYLIRRRKKSTRTQA